MAGFSIGQLSNFLGLSESRTRAIFKKLGYKKEDNMLRVPLRVASNFILDNPKYRKIFIERLNGELIEKRYRMSALILNADVAVLHALRLCDDVREAGTIDYYNILADLGFKKLIELRDFCRNGSIVAYKTNPGKTGKWRIPVYAFAVYLKEHPQYAKNFGTLWDEKNKEWMENDITMYKLNNSIRKALNRSKKEKEAIITLPLVADILQIPENQVSTIFHVKKISSAICSSQPILVSDLINYISEDDTRLENLRKRWMSCDSDDPLEPVLCRLLSHATAEKMRQDKK